MTSLNERAVALAHLLRGEIIEALPSDVAEAAIACAGDLVDAGEPRLALELLDGVERAVPNSAEREIRFRVLRAQALRVAGLFQDGLDLTMRTIVEMRDSLEVSPTDSWLLRICEGACLWQLNRVDEAVERLLAVRLQLIGKPDSPVLARCMLELSSAEIFRGRLQSAREHTLESIVSARRCGARYIEAVALGNLARIEKFLCRWSSAQEAIEEALTINNHDGHRVQALINQQLLSIVLWKRGSLKLALSNALRGQAEARALGNGVHEWYAGQIAGLVMLHQGALERSRLALGEGSHKDIISAESRRALLTAEFIGDTYLEEGKAAEALERYEAVWPLAMALVPKGDIVAELRRRRAEAYYLLRRVDDAYAEAIAGLEHCRELGDRYEEAATYRILALSAAALGKPAEAKKWFEQGFAYFDDIETPYEWGKLWMAYGDWLAGPNAAEYTSKPGAAEAYSAARDHFERMGALRKLAEAEARIAGSNPSPKPLEPAKDASDHLRRPLRRPRGAAELDRRATWARENFGFVTRNKIVLDLLEDAAKLACSGAPILILGESGTGKELVANGIHKLSGRSGNFMPINCGALPREVIESELFGHVSGAFTGASRDKIGLFESCDGGTVFLDEIAEMSLDLQTKMLRFLETGEFRRVGSNRNVAVNTLVVAATNRERGSLESGEGFRQDLYYRLAHAVLVLPPLRRRGEDLDLLISHFLEEAGQRHKRQLRLSDAARRRLLAYSWPGNVRQLRSTIHRLVVLGRSEGEIGEENLELDESQAPASLTEELLLAERRRIVEALAQAGGVRSEAARTLRMSRTTFVSKMKRYGIT